MGKFYNIKYVDACYTNAKKIKKTKLSLHEAYGYAKRKGDNTIIVFIKKKGTDVKRLLRNKENIIKGLVIPNTALVSVINNYKTDIPKNIIVGSFVAITWCDVIYVANLPRYDCSTMYTEGELISIEDDHIVLKDPETIRVYPEPIVNHPIKKPSYYIIPISFIIDIKIIKTKR